MANFGKQIETGKSYRITGPTGILYIGKVKIIEDGVAKLVHSALTNEQSNMNDFINDGNISGLTPLPYGILVNVDTCLDITEVKVDLPFRQE